MNRKLAFVVALLILHVGMSTLALNIQLINAEDKTWTVDDDGPADFRKIQEAINAAEEGDTIFVRNGKYYENIIVNKTVALVGEESADTIVEGNQTEFVVSITRSNVKVKDLTLSNTNPINTSQRCGIIAYNATNCLIQENILCFNFYGTKLSSCNNFTIIDNKISENLIGIFCESSPNCTVRHNTLLNNLYRGILIENSDNYIVCDNFVSAGNYGIRAKRSNNCTIKNNTVQRTSYYGIHISSSYDCKVNNNTVNENYNIGISVQQSTNCTISENIIKNSASEYGLEINSSNNTRVIDNTLIENCVYLMKSYDCEIRDNEVNESSNGIYVCLSDRNKLSNNTIDSNFYGLLLLESNDCVISGNTVEDSYYGVWMIMSNGNVFFHNNFVSNRAQTYIAESANVWNISVEGNYWSNYLGKDQNFDGIGDQHYIIDKNNKDNYPLLGAFSDFETSSGISIYAICNSTISNFSYEPTNLTVRFTVNGTDGTIGFCRIRIPHVLMNGTYHVTVDNVEPSIVNYDLYDDGENRWIYFAYEHSPHEVVIVSEFPSFVTMSFFMLTALLTVIFYKRRLALLRHGKSTRCEENP